MADCQTGAKISSGLLLVNVALAFQKRYCGHEAAD
jgi:hypothetical protein